MASQANYVAFAPVVQIIEDVKLVGYKWVYVRKCNEHNEITRYKERLVEQGFLQWVSIDYEDTITIWFLINLMVLERLDMRLMGVVTAYMYGSLDTNIYMKKVDEGFKMS